MSKRSIAVLVLAAAAAVAVAGAGAIASATAGAADDKPPAAPSPRTTSAPASHDPDYWTDERMRAATPAPMPVKPRE